MILEIENAAGAYLGEHPAEMTTVYDALPHIQLAFPDLGEDAVSVSLQEMDGSTYVIVSIPWRGSVDCGRARLRSFDDSYWLAADRDLNVIVDLGFI